MYCKVRKFFRNYAHENVVGALLAFVVADVDEQDFLTVVHEIMVTDVGGDVGLRPGGYGAGDELASGAAAQGHAPDGAGVAARCTGMGAAVDAGAQAQELVAAQGIGQLGACPAIC